MGNVFYENQIRVRDQRRRVRELRDYHLELSNPDLNPEDLTLEGFSDYETPLKVAGYITAQMGPKEAAFQYIIAVNAIEKLRTAMKVVEAQASLKLQILPTQEPVVLQCIEDDKRQIASLFGKAVRAVEQAQVRPEVEDELKLHARPLIQEAKTDLDGMVSGRIREDYLYMEGSELIELIGEERAECVEHILDANHSHLENTASKLNNFAYFSKLIHERVIPDNENVRFEMAKWLDGSEAALDKCDLRLSHSRKFMNLVLQMGERGTQDSMGDFRPTTYNCAPLQVLFKMTP